MVGPPANAKVLDVGPGELAFDTVGETVALEVAAERVWSETHEDDREPQMESESAGP